MQHNVNSYQNKRFQLYNAYREVDPDVILYNHTGILQQEAIKVQGYTTYKSNKQDSRYRGTAIAIKSYIEHTIEEYMTDLLAVTIETRQGPITIATDYIAPGAAYLNYMDYVQLIRRQFPVYLLGDLNAHHQILGNSDADQIGRSLARLINDGKLQHLGPNFPTLIRGTGSTKPDIVLGNDKIFHNIHLAEGPFTSSDHMPIVAKITANPIRIPIRTRFQFGRADWEGYQDKLRAVATPNLTSMKKEDIDHHIEVWTKKIKDVSEETIPKLQYRIAPGVKPTAEIIEIQRQYNELRSHINSNGTNNQLYSRLCYLRRKLRDEYIKLQDKTWNDLMQKIEIDACDPKKFWSSIKRFSGNSKQKIPYIQDEEGNRLTAPETKEPLFREHWKKILRNDQEDDLFDGDNINMVENEIAEREGEIKPFAESSPSRLIGCPPITMEELEKAIKKFKQRSPGPSGITANQLKNLPENMLRYLLTMLNHCLSIGYFPEKWKVAEMIFLPKPEGSQHQVANYRPISLLDVEGKVFDRILNDRFTMFVEHNNLTNPRQHGFRRARGTNTALACFHEKISNNMTKERKSRTDVVLRDVSKAFDKIWHHGLKYKLLKANMPTCLLKTISSFLDNRFATVRLENYIGPKFQLLSGVPQGACLSPSLYSFYTHDLGEPDQGCDYVAYADDITQIVEYRGCGKHKEAAKKTAKSIKKINDFEKKWKIKTNTNKFKVLPMSRQLTAPIDVDGSILSYTRKGKVLGLKMCSSGIREQVTYRKSIAKANLTKIKRFQRLSQRTKLRLYKGLVLPALTYPAVPLNTVSRTSMVELQRVQNEGLRFVTNTKWYDFKTSESIHQETQMEAVNVLIHRLSSNIWKKIQEDFPATYASLKNEDEIPEHWTRHKYFPSSRKKAEEDPPAPLYR